MININCGSIGIPGAKHVMLGLIPQTLFFLERASANTEGGSGYPRLCQPYIESTTVLSDTIVTMEIAM